MTWRLLLGKTPGDVEAREHVDFSSLDEVLYACHQFVREDGDRLAYLIDRIEGSVVIGCLAKGESALGGAAL